MGREKLDQVELDSLSPQSGAPAGQAAGLRRKDCGTSQRFDPPVALDFAMADRLSPRVMIALEALADAAAQDFAASLSVLARTSITARVRGAEQRAYAEFLRDLSDPTCAGISRAEPLAANVAIDIEPIVVYPLLDRLLGGTAAEAQPVNRPLTQIERRLVARVLGLFQDSLRRTWTACGNVECELLRVETNPRLLRVVTPSELVVVAVIELALGEVRGSLRLCIPCQALEPLRDRLAPLGLPREMRTASGNTTPSTVELVAELATLEIPSADLADLNVGDILTTDMRVDSPLVVRIDGRPAFHARPGAYRGRKAISLEGPIAAGDSASS